MVYTKLTSYSHKNEFRGVRQPNLAKPLAPQRYENHLLTATNPRRYEESTLGAINGVSADQRNLSGENSLFYNNWVSDEPNNCLCKNKQGEKNIPCELNTERYYCSARCPASIWDQDAKVTTERMMAVQEPWYDMQNRVLGNANEMLGENQKQFINTGSFGYGKRLNY